MTDGIVSAMTDLIALQADMPAISLDSENPAFKRDGKASRYMSLTALMETVRPLLTKHHFAWITRPGVDGLTYTLRHVGGEEVACGLYPLPVDVTPQQLGSAITYARRYSLCAVLGIVADTDDDGNAASPADGATSTETPGDRARAMAFDKGAAQAANAQNDKCADCAREGWKAKSKTGKEYPAKFWPGRTDCDGRKPNGSYANHPLPPESIPDVEPIYDPTDVPF